ncbi:MAG: NAD-dependent protein deacylase [Candidatus Coproplasma sp.]
MDKIQQLQNIFDEGGKIVFFGGAGVSTESGIPDFRSQDGLYNLKYAYPPERIISHSFFYENTEEFYRFYKDKMIISNAKPNPAHIFLAQAERAKKLDCVITQNIDGLHQLAGSKRVYELHGSIHRNYCTKCKKFHSLDHITGANGVPHCDCGGVIKPDVVLYEESLDDYTVENALSAISSADTLIIGGTSLVVYPAAGFINYFNGRHLVVINKSKTPADNMAELVINAPIGETFAQLKL